MDDNIPKNNNNTNNWVEYRRLVLFELAETRVDIKSMKITQQEQALDIREIKVRMAIRASFFGAIAGALSTLVLSVIVKLLPF